MWTKALAAVAGTFAVAIVSSGAAMAQAESYPDRPIHFIAPYNPGGTVDPTARVLGEAVSKLLGQPVVIENRAGAAGSVGTDYVVRSEPDGYTVLIHTNIVASEPCLKPTLPYDFLASMKPVAALTATPFVVLVNPAVPADTLDALVAHLKENPGELNYGASGVGSSGHLRGEQFKVETDVDIAFIPYTGGGETLAALVGNEIQVAFDTLPGSIGMINDGRLRLLAVSTPERWFLVPDTPTMDELGYPSLASQWIGAFVPKDTPDDVTAKLADAIQQALQQPEVQQQFEKFGFRVVGTGPEETLADLQEETEMWCRTIEAAGISIQ
ncbi:MAG: Bug family tripartite tricarboxylate transporter substrate binding protein [Geminicoccaceae bacterium]